MTSERPRSHMARAADLLASPGLLLGAVVSGAALGVISAKAGESTRVAATTVAVLGVYWLAHIYVDALSRQFGGSDRRLVLPRAVASARDEVGVLLGGLPAIAVYVVLTAFGAKPASAGMIALWFLIALLFVVGYFGARHAGLKGAAVLAEGVGAGLFGVLIVIMKSLLH